MTHKLILSSNDSTPQVSVSEVEHDGAKWLSVEVAFELALVWHVRQTLVFVRPKVFCSTT